jgi:hypothetical protein
MINQRGSDSFSAQITGDYKATYPSQVSIGACHDPTCSFSFVFSDEAALGEQKSQAIQVF